MEMPAWEKTKLYRVEVDGRRDSVWEHFRLFEVVQENGSDLKDTDGNCVRVVKCAHVECGETELSYKSSSSTGMLKHMQSAHKELVMATGGAKKVGVRLVSDGMESPYNNVFIFVVVEVYVLCCFLTAVNTVLSEHADRSYESTSCCCTISIPVLLQAIINSLLEDRTGQHGHRRMRPSSGSPFLLGCLEERITIPDFGSSVSG